MHVTLLPNALYNLTKFHENSSKSIGVMGHTRFCLQMDRQTDARVIAISPEPFSRGTKIHPPVQEDNLLKGFLFLALAKQSEQFW